MIDDAAGLEDDVVAYLGTLGHLRARVRGGAPEVDGDLAVVPVRVQAGPVFRIGEVRVAGVDALPRAQVTGAASTTSGEVHDLTRTARDRDRLVVLYRGEGFLDVRIVASETVREAEELVDIAFEVAEGPRQILREITVRGNVQIATDAVVRAVNLSLDRPVRAAEWLEARIRLFDTEFFRRVDLQAEAAGPADDGLQPMRAVIDVEEWPALRLRYGFEVSEEQDAADLDARNLEPGIRADVIAAP